jgi:hypothetical protein
MPMRRKEMLKSKGMKGGKELLLSGVAAWRGCPQ